LTHENDHISVPWRSRTLSFRHENHVRRAAEGGRQQDAEDIEHGLQQPPCGMRRGAIVTSVIQSSSATTVMLVEFCGRGPHEFRSGNRRGLGANVGTTVTAQLIAFKITAYPFPPLRWAFF
jgi:Na+/phosphate symporter